jgi:hypothetical protein
MMALDYQQGLFDSKEEGYAVRQIKPSESHWLLLNVHYAKRLPSISYAYGLFKDGELVGVCTFGTPSSAALRSGIAGAEYADRVLELNRLCLVNNQPNEASRLVAGSLNLLPTPAIVVSYADTEQGHEGIVYQATNFLYTGLSAKRTDWKVEGLEHLHGQTIADQVRGGEGRRIDAIKAKYGERFYLKERSRKHRYIALLGHKWEKRNMLRALKYEVIDYPKK